MNFPYRRVRDYAVAGLGISSPPYLTLSWKQIFVLKLCINTDLNSALYEVLPHCISHMLFLRSRPLCLIATENQVVRADTEVFESNCAY